MLATSAADAGNAAFVCTGGDGGHLNVRVGPGLQYRVLTILDDGDRVRVWHRRGDWIYHEYENDENGWSHGDYLCWRDLSRSNRRRR